MNEEVPEKSIWYEPINDTDSYKEQPPPSKNSGLNQNIWFYLIYLEIDRNEELPSKDSESNSIEQSYNSEHPGKKNSFQFQQKSKSLFSRLGRRPTLQNLMAQNIMKGKSLLVCNYFIRWKWKCRKIQ